MYEPRFDVDFTRGKVGEDLVGTFLESLQGNRIEVKTDYRVTETGNVYVETWQYKQPDKSDIRPSGINTTESEYWCIASPEGTGFLMVKTETLKQVLRDTQPREVGQPKFSDFTSASVGRIVPIVDILKAIGLYQIKEKNGADKGQA
jgi:glycosyltransferase involved in cell wall biosynthesis